MCAADEYAATAPQKRRAARERQKRAGRKKRIRIPIDMSRFQRDWADVRRAAGQ